MALHRCLNCGHTGNLALMDFVCPNCHEQLELIEGEASMSLPLCDQVKGQFNHGWRFVMTIAGHGLWQCKDCKLIDFGRTLNMEEVAKMKADNELPVIEQIPAPGR